MEAIGGLGLGFGSCPFDWRGRAQEDREQEDVYLHRWADLNSLFLDLQDPRIRRYVARVRVVDGGNGTQKAQDKATKGAKGA